MTDPGYALTLSCSNQPGIVAKISTLIFEAGGDIFSAQQYDDTQDNRFFMRVLFRGVSSEKIELLRSDFEREAQRLGMSWRLRDRSTRQRVMIMASKFDHCLADLIYRWRRGELNVDITAIVSNHPKETYAALNLTGLDFYYLPVKKETKAQQEEKLWALFQSTRSELIILARYMQILSDDLSQKLSGRCINIHHSFLPSFKGAKPYHQAHARGVKVIGATAHYVTADLDEGPIIEQDVERISHEHTPEDLVQRGRDIERRVLARALRYHIDDRVMLSGNRTVVFAN